ncbi:class II fructose-bisphosphate aldolase [Actinospica sp.]|jgi:fructose-bisphosphate aldolase class II|uniref:class II fructose-bisphosphate aldolase n=1 Tax=Actinospica sp. TaxID=1872142 RepID=UPI002BA544B7|nr:class II fructose-bisphosphate aldolase [Actinospica sp.]HWG22539.1 class II fructose-bisphosphate aldolase [Actinospica sp.]
MTLASTGSLLADARAEKRAVAAFNVITLEHAEGIVAGAERAGRPVILQISENAVKFHDGCVLPIALAAHAMAEAANVPVSLHLDHVEHDGLLHQATDAGFSSVMFDASHSSYAENVELTRRAADWAHANGLLIESELGQVGGKDGVHLGAHEPGARTDPDEAAAYVASTGVDALAVAVGSSHAMTKRTAGLDFALIEQLRDAVLVPLVLHGSSGVPDDALAKGVRAGIVKVNIGTALNMAYTGAVRSFLADDAKAVDPRKYLESARSALTDTVAQLITVIS